MKLKDLMAKTHKGLLFTLLAIVLVTLMLAIVVTYILLGIDYNNQATQSYGILGASDFASSIQSAMPSILTTSLQNALGAYMSANIVGWWPLSGNTNDYSTSGNGGTPTNIIYSTVNGIYSSSFNGIVSYVQVPSTSGLNIGTSDFSVSAWIYANSWSTNPQLIGKEQCVSCSAGWDVGFMSNGQQEADLNDGTAIEYTNIGNTLSTNAWYNVVYVFTRSSTLTTYVNGVFSGSVSISAHSGSLSNTYPSVIGTYVASGGSTNSNFNGLITNVQLYNTALSASRAAGIYSEGIGGMLITPASSSPNFPINASAANTLSALVLGIQPVSGSTLSGYFAALQKQALSHNVNVIIANQSVTVFQASPLWLNVTYSALAVVNSTFGTVMYPLRASAALPESTAYTNVTVSNMDGASFNGGSSYVDLNNPATLQFGSGTTFALSAWINIAKLLFRRSNIGARILKLYSLLCPFRIHMLFEFRLVRHIKSRFWYTYLYECVA